jgi:hypothetical protein
MVSAIGVQQQVCGAVSAVCYSVRSASTGSMRDARTAG